MVNPKRNKIIIFTILAVILINWYLPLYSNASNESDFLYDEKNVDIIETLKLAQQHDGGGGSFGDSSSTNSNTGGTINILDGVLGIITYPFKLLILLPGLLAQSIMSLIASTGTPNGGIWLTVDNILFNQLALTDINIFSDSIFLIGANGEYEQQALNSGNTLLNIRESIAQWYFAFRNLAIVVALLMLIYIGIRMAISNIAEEKAKYKAMLINWFVGFSLIFVLHFIIIFVIEINNGIIEILAKTNLTDNQEAYKNIMNQLFEQSWWIDFTISWASTIMYGILIIITFIILIMFIKRFVTISFLALVAPLITVTYAMDKAGDNKSQILNTWLKEFCYNVLVQIVYALCYLIFAKVGMDIMMTDLDFGALAFAVLSLLAMFLGVKVVKQIFGFDKAGNLVQQLAMGTVISKTISVGKNAIAMGKQIRQDNQNKSLNNMNLPMNTPSGADTNKVLQEALKKKKKQAIDEKIAQKSKENAEKDNERGKTRNKRSLKNVSTKIKTPVRAYTRTVKGALVKGLGIDKIQEAVNTNKTDKITLNAQDVVNAMLADYVKYKNPKMNQEEFQQTIDYVQNTKFDKLESGDDVILKGFIEDTKKQQGEAQARKMIANFKDTIV